MYIFIAVLLLILAIFGVAGMMDSYATAKQAQATIEVAQVAQVNAWGNLIVILLLALVILCVAGVIVWMVIRSQQSAISRQRSHKEMISAVSGDQSAVISQRSAKHVDINSLIQLEVLNALRAMRGTPLSSSMTSPQMEEHNLRGERDDGLEWLR